MRSASPTPACAHDTPTAPAGSLKDSLGGSPGSWAQPTSTSGLYGPRGWSVRAGVWRLLAQWSEALRPLAGQAPGGGLVPAGLDSQGAPRRDYVPFAGMDAAGAAALLEALPQEALGDRQNLAPSLGSLLRACSRAGDTLRLSGYGIGPQRPDERVSVEAVWVSDPDLAGYKVSAGHAPGCACQELWDQVRRRYDLDYESVPDEVLWLRPEWADGRQGWWLWWD